ncbi:MAG TPA: response regulator transcription factor [Ilumatobacteraceae bacterium]
MERQTQIGVLVVDAHHIVAQGLALVINSEPTMRVLGTAGSIREAVDLCNGHRPLVVLMDIGLPDGDAMAAITRIRTASPSTKIVIVTGSTDDTALGIAVDTGCAGYVHKTASTDDLLCAVATVAEGRAYFPPAALARLLFERRSAPHGAHTVSDREREVLQLLADGRTVADIANVMGLSAHTVRNHIRRAMKHLGVHTRLDAVVAAARAGLLSVEMPKSKRSVAC